MPAGGGFATTHSQVSLLPPYDQRAGQSGQQQRRMRLPSEDRVTGPGLLQACGKNPAWDTPRPVGHRTSASRLTGASPAPCKWTSTFPSLGLWVLTCEVRLLGLSPSGSLTLEPGALVCNLCSAFMSLSHRPYCTGVSPPTPPTPTPPPRALVVTHPPALPFPCSTRVL